MDLRTQDVQKFFGKKQILKGIDFQLRPKEFVGLIGPNGSGKSTFLKCLYRVLKPSSGLIEFNGQKLDELSYRDTALQLAVVAQHNMYSFDFSVLDVVLMGRAPHKRMLERDNAYDFEIARKSLAEVGLSGFEDRVFSTLSGGEQQRVVLARALSQETECLILDEPTNHLDITYQLQILDIVKSLDITVLSAIHDLSIAAMYCDRIIAMRDGEIVGMGTPRELLTEDFIYDLYKVRSVVHYDDARDQLGIQYIPEHRY